MKFNLASWSIAYSSMVLRMLLAIGTPGHPAVRKPQTSLIQVALFQINCCSARRCGSDHSRIVSNPAAVLQSLPLSLIISVLTATTVARRLTDVQY
jgi:hypothetical protein